MLPGEPDWLPAGNNFPCEACADRRLASRREEAQDFSGLTASEKILRLDDILVQGRPGTAQMVAGCRELLDKSAFFLTLWGEHGNGKSMALTATLNQFLEPGHVRAVPARL